MITPILHFEKEQGFLANSEFIREDRIKIPKINKNLEIYQARTKKRTIFIILQYQLSTGGGGYILLEMSRFCGMSLYKSAHANPGGGRYCCEMAFTSPIERVDIPVSITPNYKVILRSKEGYIEEGDEYHYPASCSGDGG